jgi:hypothetical protein
MKAVDLVQSARYVVDQNGERVAVQLSMEAWQAVLNLLDSYEVTGTSPAAPDATQAAAPQSSPHKPPKPAGPLRFGEVRARFDPEEYAERRD